MMGGGAGRDTEFGQDRAFADELQAGLAEDHLGADAVSGATATPWRPIASVAWGTSVAQVELRACRLDGCGNLRRVAADIRAVLVQRILCPAELLDGAAAEGPVLGEAGRGAQCALFAAAADADRAGEATPGVGQLAGLAAERAGFLR